MGTMQRRRRLGYGEHVQQDRQLRFIAAERSVVVIVTPLAIHQVCQIIFTKRDGSILVQSPYFRNKEGIVTRLTIPVGASGPVNYDLKEAGKVTSHLVKFVHHPDGRVHWSQDGKVRTEIVGQSFPLGDSIGHVFELHGFYLGGFETITSAKAGRAYLPFAARSGLPTTVQVTAQWRRRSSILSNIVPKGGATGPVAEIMSRKTGQRGVAFFLGQPAGFPFQEHVLMIECASPPMPETVDRETLVMMGGWEKPDVTGRPFLLATYPVESPTELARVIGSIDLDR